MVKFEKVSKYKDADFNLPVRKTANSAGYDFEIAEDIVIPSFQHMIEKMDYVDTVGPIDLQMMGAIIKTCGVKLPLVSTGVKCYLSPGTYLELSMRSSTPLKYWLVMANSVGIIDADYADNPDNEGEIFFQVINMSPFDLQLKRGDIIGQGIIHRYEITSDDTAAGERLGGFGSTSI